MLNILFALPSRSNLSWPAGVNSSLNLVYDALEDNSQIMGTPGKHFYVWDIKNGSTWPVFLTLTVDGVTVGKDND